MMFTRLESNALLLALMLFIIQGLILYDIQTANGGMAEFVIETPIDKLAVAFSPTGVLGFMARYYSRK